MIQLRPYQLAAVDSAYTYLRERDGNPCVVIPTGGGKTPIIARLCTDAVTLWNGRVLVLAHVKELLEQAADKMRTMAPELPIGIYSAGLGAKDLGYAVTIAGIQSIYAKAAELGPLDLVIVDEAHLISDDENSMYRQLLAGIKERNLHSRVIGLTATPYRMKTGMICGPDSILTEVCFEVGVRELIAGGFICPLRSKAGIARADMDGLHVRAGEFVASEVESLMDEDSLVRSACAEIVDIAQHRRSVLIFCAGIHHGQHVTKTIESMGYECGFVNGLTTDGDRTRLLSRFRDGDLRFLANVNVLTTGFDAPNIDLVALLRPTLSPGLYYQMCGRGFRMHPGKKDCIVLDFGGNVLRHGPIDAIKIRKPGEPGSGEAPAKECPSCMALIAAGYSICPECGHVFPKPESSMHSATAATGGVLTGQVERTVHPVLDTTYSVHIKRNDESAPTTMRVAYRVGFNYYKNEWICFNHEGYARQKAEQWWKRRSKLPVPETTEQAVQLAHQDALSEALEITVEKKAGEKYERIVAWKLSPIPEPVAAEVDPYDDIDYDDLPF